MTFPMTLAYVDACAAARSCLGASADISDLDDSCRYERLLIDLDGSHGGDLPATYPMPGTRPELLAHLEDEVDRMIELGGDGLSLELLLAQRSGVVSYLPSELVEEVFVDPANRRDLDRLDAVLDHEVEQLFAVISTTRLPRFELELSGVGEGAGGEEHAAIDLARHRTEEVAQFLGADRVACLVPLGLDIDSVQPYAVMDCPWCRRSPRRSASSRASRSACTFSA